jgi:hypothetical protein
MFCQGMTLVMPKALPIQYGFRGRGKNHNLCHFEARSDEESLFLAAFEARGIPRYARDDGVFAFFRNLFSP